LLGGVGTSLEGLCLLSNNSGDLRRGLSYSSDCQAFVRSRLCAGRVRIKQEVS
jgi:hypothetical protein